MLDMDGHVHYLLDSKLFDSFFKAIAPVFVCDSFESSGRSENPTIGGSMVGCSSPLTLLTMEYCLTCTSCNELPNPICHHPATYKFRKYKSL